MLIDVMGLVIIMLHTHGSSLLAVLVRSQELALLSDLMGLCGQGPEVEVRHTNNQLGALARCASVLPTSTVDLAEDCPHPPHTLR
jgi:hypothetical protein